MKTVLEIIDLSESFLKRKGFARARREAEELIADVLNLRRLDLYLQFERPLTEEEIERLRQAIKLRAEGVPREHISGQTVFADCLIKVTKDVLIPRPETEILVEKISGFLKTQELAGKVLWDVACGSGCIGIALKKRFPELQVVLSDISKEALVIARENAKEMDVSLVQGDLFEPFQGKACDFFVSNPPYVSLSEYSKLSLEVHKEPKIALVSGVTGLEFYKRIADNLRNFLKEGGNGWLELGSGQGDEVKAIFESKGYSCYYEKDWSGHDRFFFLSIEKQ